MNIKMDLATDILKGTFGYSNFRGEQLAIIELMAGAEMRSC